MLSWIHMSYFPFSTAKVRCFALWVQGYWTRNSAGCLQKCHRPVKIRTVKFRGMNTLRLNLYLPQSSDRERSGKVRSHRFHSPYSATNLLIPGRIVHIRTKKMALCLFGLFPQWSFPTLTPWGTTPKETRPAVATVCLRGQTQPKGYLKGAKTERGIGTGVILGHGGLRCGHPVHCLEQSCADSPENGYEAACS